jgi:adenine/guanine phosphoribosyltransferase-like PRPP-binding protein
MKAFMKYLKWAVIIASAVAIPFMLVRRSETLKRNDMNIRYDINDYLSDLEA